MLIWIPACAGMTAVLVKLSEITTLSATNTFIVIPAHDCIVLLSYVHVAMRRNDGTLSFCHPLEGGDPAIDLFQWLAELQGHSVRLPNRPILFIACISLITLFHLFTNGIAGRQRPDARGVVGAIVGVGVDF